MAITEGMPPRELTARVIAFIPRLTPVIPLSTFTAKREPIPESDERKIQRKKWRDLTKMLIIIIAETTRQITIRVV